MTSNIVISADEALNRLREVNRQYIELIAPTGDISPEIRKDTCENGLNSYASSEEGTPNMIILFAKTACGVSTHAPAKGASAKISLLRPQYPARICR